MEHCILNTMVKYLMIFENSTDVLLNKIYEHFCYSWDSTISVVYFNNTSRNWLLLEN